MIRHIWVRTTKESQSANCAGDPGSPLILGLYTISELHDGDLSWDLFLKPLADAGYFVVSLSLAGLGVPNADPPAMVSRILDELGHETAIIMGKGQCSRIAYQVAIAQPERISHLVLSSPRLSWDEIGQAPQLKSEVLMTWQDKPMVSVSLKELRRFRQLNPDEYETLALDDARKRIESSKELAEALPNFHLETYFSGSGIARNNVDDFAPKILEFLKLT